MSILVRSSIYALSVLTVLALASARAAETLASVTEQNFRTEADQLRRSSDGSCQGCYFAKMLGLMFPLPERYAAQLSPLEQDRCVTFISPRWTLQRAPVTQDSRSLRMESGMIKLCPRAVLENEIARMKTPASEQSVRGTLSISIWGPGENSEGRTVVYVSNGSEALWISDPSPYLGKVMIEVATSARTQ